MTQAELYLNGDLPALASQVLLKRGNRKTGQLLYGCDVGQR